VHSYVWLGSSKHLIYLEDTSGAGDLRAYAVSVAGGTPTPLTQEARRAGILRTSIKRPDHALLLSNARDERHFDVLEVDVRTNSTKTVLLNDLGWSGFVADDSLRVRLAEKPLADGGYSLHEIRGAAPANWPELARFDVTEAASSRSLQLDPTGSQVFLLDNRGRDYAALTALSLRTKQTTVLFESDEADVGSAMFDARGSKLLAVATIGDRRVWQAVDQSIAADLKLVARAAEGDMDIVSRSKDDKTWLTAVRRPDSPTRYFRYERGLDKSVALLFSSDRLLETTELYPMTSTSFRARDGLELELHLTLPQRASKDARVPLVLWVHGGPWARDRWEFNPYHQLFASRGYAALSVNYRGSRGLGKTLLNAGNGEWGGKMQDDLTDAVAWAIGQGIADTTRIAIGGADYGGYAAMMGLALASEQFACGINIGGPADLAALLEQGGAYFAPTLAELKLRIGDPTTPSGLGQLKQRSPSEHASKIKLPLLVIEGGNDPRENQLSHLVGRLANSGVPVTHLSFPDDGHVIRRADNRLAAAAAIDVFLAQCFGTAYEPYGADLKRSSGVLKAGGALLNGLDEALRQK
jgi:dipeptidyl aminopeptidase/acylaminoacyl peptidase